MNENHADGGTSDSGHPSDAATIPPPDDLTIATMPEEPMGKFHTGQLLLGRYRVIGKLGQGGMGVVCRCRDEVAGIDVALKAIPPELSGNPAEMEDVRENFRLISRLHHPNIANANTLERDPGTGECFLIMECVEGISLSRYRKMNRDGKLSLQQVIPVLRQIAAALDYAHSQRIVHRDIKPANVMLLESSPWLASDRTVKIDPGAAPSQVGSVKVLDFGLAFQIRDSLSKISRPDRGTSGTGPYMAPEQWRGECQDEATDQYALAAMTYELLAGKCPFESHELAVLREAVLHGTPRPIRGIPSGAWRVIARGLAKERKARYASCTAFVEALSASCMGERRISRPVLAAAVIGLLTGGLVCGYAGWRWHLLSTRSAAGGRAGTADARQGQSGVRVAAASAGRGIAPAPRQGEAASSVARVEPVPAAPASADAEVASPESAQGTGMERKSSSEQSAKGPPPMGTLLVRGVEGAAVFEDGRLLGQAGHLISGVTPGQHDLVVRKSGYRPGTVAARIQAGAVTEVDATLGPLPAELVFSCQTPGLSLSNVDVRIDGGWVGNADRKYPVLPDVPHKVSLKSRGFQEAVENIVISRGEQRTNAVLLVRAVAVASRPPLWWNDARTNEEQDLYAKGSADGCSSEDEARHTAFGQALTLIALRISATISSSGARSADNPPAAVAQVALLSGADVADETTAHDEEGWRAWTLVRYPRAQYDKVVRRTPFVPGSRTPLLVLPVAFGRESQERYPAAVHEFEQRGYGNAIWQTMEDLLYDEGSFEIVTLPSKHVAQLAACMDNMEEARIVAGRIKAPATVLVCNMNFFEQTTETMNLFHSVKNTEYHAELFLRFYDLAADYLNAPVVAKGEALNKDLISATNEAARKAMELLTKRLDQQWKRQISEKPASGPRSQSL